MSKISLLLCSHQSRKDFIGGAEIVLLELAKYVRRDKFNVIFLTNEAGLVDDIAKRSAVKVQVIPYEVFWGLLAPGKKILSDWKAFLLHHSQNIHTIKSFIIQNRIDVVISNCIVNVTPLIAAKELMIPSIWIIQEIIFAFEKMENRLRRISRLVFSKKMKKQKLYALNQLKQIILEYSDTAIFLSETAKKRIFHPDEHRDKILVDYLPIRHDIYAPSASAETPPLMKQDESLVVAFLGIIIKHKGVHDFIKAAYYVTKEVPDVKFTIAGGTPDHSYFTSLKRLIRRYQLEDKVIFTGFLENPLPVYDQADIICMTSLYDEPFGMVVSEGMIRAKVVIAYETGSIREIIDDGYNGFIVPRGNPQALAKKIIYLADNRALMRNIAKNAAITASKKFNPDQYLQRIQRLLEKAVGSK